MFTLTIETDNEAFAEYPHDEIARILHELAELLPRIEPEKSGSVRDINGNRVGDWDLT
jgi:hypothetical protein